LANVYATSDTSMEDVLRGKNVESLALCAVEKWIRQHKKGH